MFYGRFYFDNETLVTCSFTQWKWTYIYIYIHIYWILDLEGEVHSIWDLWVSGLQECKCNEIFFEIGRACNKFRWVQKIDALNGRLPLPGSDTSKSSLGGGLFNILRILPSGIKRIHNGIRLLKYSFHKCHVKGINLSFRRRKEKFEIGFVCICYEGKGANTIVVEIMVQEHICHLTQRSLRHDPIYMSWVQSTNILDSNWHM